MINIIASIHLKTGTLAGYLEILEANLSAVRNEKGCIEYVPMVDIAAKLPTQILDDNVVTILEKWESLEVLHAHLGSPHMLDYREKVKKMVERVDLKVLREADSISVRGKES